MSSEECFAYSFLVFLFLVFLFHFPPHIYAYREWFLAKDRGLSRYPKPSFCTFPICLIFLPNKFWSPQNLNAASSTQHDHEHSLVVNSLGSKSGQEEDLHGDWLVWLLVPLLWKTMVDTCCLWSEKYSFDVGPKAGSSMVAKGKCFYC